MTDLRQSPEFASYMEKIGWKVDRIKNTVDSEQLFIRKIPLLGNFVKIQRPTNYKDINLDLLAKKYRAFAIQINFSPTKTLQIDLTLSLDHILDQMNKETRYEIRKAEKNNLRISTHMNHGESVQFSSESFYSPVRRDGLIPRKLLTDELSDSPLSKFISLWHKNAWERGFWIPFKKEIKAIWEAFGENAYLIAAVKEKTILSGTIILIHEKTASYMHAASSKEGRNLSAPSLVVWQAIKLAKEKGCIVFDFEGIYDERFPIKSWQGFTRFKKGFGGKEIEYPGNFTKYYNPLLLNFA